MHADLLTFIAALRHWLDWAPAPLASAIVLLIVALVALVASRLLTNLFLRFPGERGAFVRQLVKGMRRPARGFIVITAMGLALPAAGLPYAWFAAIGQGLLVILVLFIGWGAANAVHILADGYLSRLKMGEEDNLTARKHITQVRILRRALDSLIFVVSISAALMTFEPVRQYGVSLFASAGAASLVVGLAARPLLTNLIAGMQIAITQPIRMEDAVVVEGEWGWIEEITSTYVVVRLWDWRRMILPISYFLEKPFQNWTHNSASLIGSVFFHLDYRAPVERLRTKLSEIVEDSPLWDGKVVNLQVSDTTEHTIEIRLLVSARNAPQTWDLRCEVREKMLRFLRDECPDAFPQTQVRLRGRDGNKPRDAPGPTPRPGPAAPAS